MDMMEVAHAKKAQSLVSDQDYRLTLHQYTSLPDDMKVQAAKRAYALQSEVRYSEDSGRMLLSELACAGFKISFQPLADWCVINNIEFDVCVCYRTCIALT